MAGQGIARRQERYGVRLPQLELDSALQNACDDSDYCQDKGQFEQAEIICLHGGSQLFFQLLDFLLGLFCAHFLYLRIIPMAKQSHIH